MRLSARRPKMSHISGKIMSSENYIEQKHFSLKQSGGFCVKVITTLKILVSLLFAAVKIAADCARQSTTLLQFTNVDSDYCLN